MSEEVSIWSTDRRGKGLDSPGPSEHRTPFERDYDRLLFSSAIRRMADKAQVFPFERDGNVRNRLTHSHEVSNLARSIGHRIVRNTGVFKDEKKYGTEIKDAVPVILASVGLAHDLGNPPFGHQGENAIRAWFHSKERELFFTGQSELLSADHRQDFLNFEGNAQTLRLLSCLQVTAGDNGLDLTAATLAALMKYTAPSGRASKSAGRQNVSLKKPGYAASESDLVDWVRDRTGLLEGQRHPLTWIMEACDDIAYSVLDVEDAMKRAIASPEDVLHHLRSKCGGKPKVVFDSLQKNFEKCDSIDDPARAREVKASYLRTGIIQMFVVHVTSEFEEHKDAIFGFSHGKALLEGDSEQAALCEELKAFARVNTYNHPSVLRAELEGDTAISSLMDWFWMAIQNREVQDDLASRRTDAFSKYVYAIISDNYRWEVERSDCDAKLSVRYRELRLLADMISGMTDDYVIELYQKLKRLADGRRS